MPIVDLVPPDLNAPVSTPQNFAVTPGAVDMDGSDAPVERPAWSATVAAAFRQDNTVGSFFAAEDREAPTFQEPGFNAWDVIKGTKYEPMWESFVDVRNSRAAELRKAKIDREEEDRKTLAAAPWWQSLPSQMAAGVFDVTTLAPGGTLVRGIKGGISIARSAASVGVAAGAASAVQESALQSMQETRPLSESAINIGASVFLGGLLGAGGAKLLSNAEWTSGVQALERDLTARMTAGAAPGAPVAPALGFVRFFHGGDDPTSGGGRWVTPDPEYARNFRAEGGPKNVHYVDIPESDPAAISARLWDELDEQGGGTNMVGRYGNVELPEEWARHLRPFGDTGAGGNAPTSAGAAAVTPAGVEANAIAGKAAGVVAAATAKLNPALRILQSPSAATREVGTQLFENSLYLKKNFEGVASEPAVETLMKEWNSGLAKAITATNDAFPEYRKAGGQMGREEFRQAVGRAMRRGDVDLGGDPHVMRVAEQWRSQVFNPLKDAAIDAKLLPPDVTVETAASYFSRMWNRNRLNAQEGRFKQIVQEWVERQAPKWAEDFDKETIARSAKLKDEALREYQIERRIERESRFDAKEAGRDIANEVFATLTGRTGEGPRPEFITVKARGPLKERTFNIPDDLVEQFLESDVELVGRRYARIMGADVELARKFGSPDLVEQLQKIRDDYARLRQGVTNEKELIRLGNREKADIRDLEALRDLLRGTRQESQIERNYGRITRAFNHVNYIRSMGEVVLASLTDAVRPAMVHGLSAYMGGLGQLATNMKGVKLSVAEAQLAGNVAERVLGARLATLSDIIDPYASRGPVEAFLENMTNVASKWNGIRMWTDMQKSFASVMTQERILKGVESFGKIKDRERSYLAFLGIDQSTAERIGKQFAAHGETIDGVRVANTESWTDQVAVRRYRAAINKDVDSIIVQRSVADVPLFASTPTGRAVLQFKSFALASHQKILLRGLQEDQARFVGGTVAMTLMGMFITYMKAISANRPEVQEKAINNPGWWIAEGLDRTGVMAVPMEIANTFEKAAGFNPIKAPIRMFDQSAGMSQKVQNRSEIGSLLGPTIGMGQDVMTTLGIPKRLAEGEELTQGQRGARDRLIPFSSYLGVRQMLQYLVRPEE